MPEHVKHIEWHDLDKRKFYFFGPTLFLGIRTVLYPANLVKTRLQVQRNNALYNGSMDAFVKVARTEGIRGLYKGFTVSCFGLFAGQCYITTYELVRARTSEYSTVIRGFLAGGFASVIGQTITVPVDVVSQKLMIQGQGNHTVKLKNSKTIVKEIILSRGPIGLYKGYLASLMTYAPTSAIWWASYGVYTGLIGSIVPAGTYHVLVLAPSGVMAGVTAACMTNPLDIVRTRLQVEGGNSMLLTFKSLIQDEGLAALAKGLSARVLSMAPSSFMVVLAYETVKRLSLKEEEKNALVEEELYLECTC